MFTGIIEELGRVSRVTRKGEFYTLEIEAQKVLEGTKTGDSIAVNGVCLTVTSLSSGKYTCDVMSETLRRSTLKQLTPGSTVNLERAQMPGSRLGGHIVAGHVDEVGTISRKEFAHNAYVFTINVTADLMKYIASKGSIAIDGISLTVVNTSADSFTVSIIPHTMENTVLPKRESGDHVNVEVDVLARYVVNYMEKIKPRSNVDWENIAKVGL